MPITEADRQYLKHKNRGGKNNAKGNRYENYYAVLQIALLLNSHHERLDDVYLTTQLSNAFVDDLLIGVGNSNKTYHQIKDVISRLSYTEQGIVRITFIDNRSIKFRLEDENADKARKRILSYHSIRNIN